MHLLILTPQIPYPPHQGTSLRNFNIIRGLSKSNNITLISFQDGGQKNIPQNLEPLEEIIDSLIVVPTPPERSVSKRILQMVFSTDPDIALRLQSEPFEKILQKALGSNKFDLVQIEGLEMAWSIKLIRKFKPKIKIVFDAHNAEAILQKRAMSADKVNPRRWPAVAYSWIQTKRLKTYESMICANVDWVTSVSADDREQLLAQTKNSTTPITVIPNCIDVKDYYYDENFSGKNIEAHYSSDLVFTGKMDYRPNVDAVLWFAEKVWPEIKSAIPTASWVIVGQKPHPRLKKLKTIQGITVTGWVDQVQPYLQGAKVFIMPFRVGSGTRLKLIEAFASGIAVVSTPVGVEGFPVENERELLLASSPKDLAAATIRLINDPALRIRLGKSGRLFAKNYDWRVVVPKFEKVYQSIMK